MIHHKDIEELGFARHEMDDPTYFDQYGVPYFWYEKNLTKNLQLEWGPLDGCFLHYLKTSKAVKIESLNVLKDLIYLFSKEGIPTSGKPKNTEN